MLTGFTQSGSSELYNSNGDADVMARLEFEVNLKVKEVLLSFEYSGEDELFSTVLVKDGSPPQNVLLSKPTSANYIEWICKS